MTDRRYRGDGVRPAGANTAVWKSRPELYRPSLPLVHAVNVALLLGKPLLLTGEPGTGKTDLATALAWELGLDEPERFDTRSTSEFKQLFYTFDALGRFHEAHSTPEGKRAAVDPKHFLEFQALGTAILRTRDRESIRDLLPDDTTPHAGPVQSVVLVDEIDKAPRDFPNDLLGALDRMQFAIPELRGRPVKADPLLRPIVIATSNSENVLPEPFLRRCIYHHIGFPDAALLRTIVASRADAWIRDLLTRQAQGALAGTSAVNDRIVESAVGIFTVLRDAQLRKRPATAELIEWVTALHARADSKDGTVRREAVDETIGVLVKRKEDLDDAKRAIDRHFEPRT